MTDEWLHTTLGGTAEIYGGGTPSTKEPAYWGGEITWLTPTEVVRADGQRISASERTITEAGLANSSAKLLPRGSVLLTTRASIGFTAIADAPVATNQGFQSLIPHDQVLPEFLMYWIQGNREEFTRRAGGSTFPEISKSKVADIPITVPPLSVQRRIVDLMAHLDNHIANLRAEREAAVEVLSRAAVERLLLPGDSGTPISDLLLRNIGGVWGESLGTGDQTVDVFRSTEFTDLGYLSGPADARRDVAAGQLASRELAVGDVLVEKSGGTPTRSVGRVVRLEAADLVGPAVGANFLQLLRVNPDLADPGYVFWILWAAHRRGDAFGFQQASTNIRNLKTKDYLDRRVDLPAPQTQAEVAAGLDSILLRIRGSDREVNALTALRGQLLSNLLSGSVEIPGDYDHLLSEVA
jgi:hypothetical protein